MQQPIRIAIVDDHNIVLDGLAALIKGIDTIELVFTSTQATKAIDMIQDKPIDILITDIMMPAYNGIDLAKDAKIVFPEIKILALSMNCDFQTVDTLINDADIEGYALKNIDKTELETAIIKIAAGGVYYSPEVLTVVEKIKLIKATNEGSLLTKREIEIIRLIEQERSSKDIADQLFISERTVETHRKNIIRKTKVTTAIGLIKYAYEHRLIEGK